jgi:hypothetical protein
VKISGDYSENGYARIEGLVSPEVARAFLAQLKQDMGPGAIPLSKVATHPNLLKRPALEIYGHHYQPMLFFLWGLTPIVSEIVGKSLLPTYDYLRVYRRGDVCMVHSDRYSCEHSLSLTLGYSDGKSWDLEVERQSSKPSANVDPSFEGEPARITTMPGDAILYRGVDHRHGRTRPNPNRWSAHLFLHWVDANGAYRDHAFDRRPPAPVDFLFA